MGFCYTCGEKWTGKLHKCPDQVPIHMLQEVMELFQLEGVSDSESSEPDKDVSEGFCNGCPTSAVRSSETCQEDNEIQGFGG